MSKVLINPLKTLMTLSQQSFIALDIPSLLKLFPIKTNQGKELLNRWINKILADEQAISFLINKR